MIYAVYSSYGGHHDCGKAHGYFTDKVKAEKYIAKKNHLNECAKVKYPNTRDEGYTTEQNHVFEILELSELPEEDFSIDDVELRYYHKVVFDYEENLAFKFGMRDEPDRYEAYTGIPKNPSRVWGFGWVSFSFDCESREMAEKIAQAEFDKFMSLYREYGCYKRAAHEMGMTD
jgi:hypothetical protein